MKPTILIFALLCITFSCKKKPTVITTTNSLPEAYLPNTAGSTWIYQLTGIINSTKTIACLDRDTIFSNHPLYTFDIMDAESFGYEYQCRKANDYYITVPYSTTTTPYKVIKGDALINDKWIGAINGTDTYYVQLLEKDINYSVDTANFSKVMHIKQTRVDNNNNITMNLDTWVAYNIGIVNTEGTVSGFPYKSRLINAVIK